MTFEMQIISNTPLVGETDLDIAAQKFFEQIGYLSKGSDHNIPYKIFTDFFLKHPTKAWLVDQIAMELHTSRPTVYRHLNKLKGFDIIEDVQIFDEATKQHKKGYQLRYGNFQKAWNFVEAHLKVAIENYSKSVEHIQKLLDEHRKGTHE